MKGQDNGYRYDGHVDGEAEVGEEGFMNKLDSDSKDWLWKEGVQLRSFAQ